MAEPAHENRLAGETSPYLLQHAHNPVDWYPWGDEALARARALDRPILLSIGYAACHWCHVMERESFEDEAIARLMNEHFVCIKVDREERPDLDEIYMAATVAMSGSGGWPMTVFLTPEQEPFFAGTYFPPEDRYGRPGFPSLLRRIHHLWTHEREALALQAGELTEHVRSSGQTTGERAFGVEAIDAAFSQLRGGFDPTYGGFGAAPKFPPCSALELLLRHHRRTGESMALLMVRVTLDGMARGGMRDHIGGGFARYSTDERWLVPHFEKMLYDNAQLARCYLHAFQVTGEPRYRDVVVEVLDYVLREMTSPEGAFYTATDADSEGEEGKYFVWSPAEVRAVLEAPDADAMCAYYDITAEGNWEGKSIAHTPRPADVVADELGIAVEELETRVAAGRKKLHAARGDRVPPLLDDKVLTGWNALMVGTMAECGLALDEPRYRAAAARAADYLLGPMRRPDGGLYRTSRAGKVHLDGYLEDHAFTCDALIDVYEASGGVRYLREAEALGARIVADFSGDDGGAFYQTGRAHEPLLARMREGQDGAIPSANAVAARALVRLSWHLGRSELRERAEAALRAHGRLIERAPRAFATSLAVADMLLEGPVEVVLAGGPEDARTSALRAAVGRHYQPSRVLVYAGDDALAPASLLEGKGEIDGAPAVYVCRDHACRAPVTDPARVGEALGADTERALAGRSTELGQRLPGGATVEGTARYVARHRLGPDAHRPLGRTGWATARIGFGGYRVDDAVSTHRDALAHALSSGMNLVDTSTNYGDGGSERLVGATLAELVGRGEIARDEVIVVSKIGYVQAQNLARAKARIQAGEPFEEMVEYADGCWHCLHPDFLADQLARSLSRLGLEKLDVCLLHNPEYFLSDAKQRGGVDEATRDVFYARLERAFAYLQEQVEAGRLGCYGVSSNTVAYDPDDEEATDLARMLEAARRGGGEGHAFAVLQLPLNLLESRGVAVLAQAEAAGLAVLANRPLNAFGDGGMFRLAEVPQPEAAAPPLAAGLQALRAAEARFAAELLEPLAARVEGGDLGQAMRFADALASLDGKLDSVEQLDQVAQQQVLPRVRSTVAALERAVPPALRERWTAWRGALLGALEQVLGALGAQAAERGHAHVVAMRRRLAPALPEARRGEALQRIALWTLLGTPGLTVALLGMRRRPYVDDALAVLGWPRLDDSQPIYEAARRVTDPA